MIFNEYIFIFIFLPVVLTIFYFPGFCAIRVWWLIAASLVFYGYAGLNHALVLVFNIFVVYLLTSIKSEKYGKLIASIAALIPLSFLIYYKYSNFLINDIFPFLDFGDDVRRDVSQIVLPAGISFFTFQLIAYAWDRHSGKIPENISFSKFSLYISMFPQLVAGPILRYHDVDHALSHLRSFKGSAERWYYGIGYIVFGLASKVLLADQLGRYVSQLSTSPGAMTRLEALYLSFAYSFQIYFDFYGYSLAAIGIGQILGFNIPANFRRPYSALNPREFWRRWHITLSLWLRDYVYIPFGGNRKYIRNIIIVFVLCGLWHGAGVNFMVWGGYHAVLVSFYKLTQKWWDRMPIGVQWGLNFTLVSLGWLLFRFDFNGAWLVLKAICSPAMEDAASTLGFTAWAMLAVSSIACFGVRYEKIIHKTDWPPLLSSSYAIILSVLFVFTLLFFDRSTTFIYFIF